ncbi:MAG: Cif family virulence factor [Smithellaceae bacterium]
MKKSALFFLMSIVLFMIFISACDKKDSSTNLLNDISGVWRAQSDGTMVSIIYKESKLRMLIGDDSIPVTLGEIDESNETVNLNITKDGKPFIWTLRRIWDKEKKSFHLVFTLDNGTQDNLSFVRKISADDMNKIANAEAKVQGSIAASVKTTPTTPAEPVAPAAPEVTASTPPEPAAPITAPMPSNSDNKEVIIQTKNIINNYLAAANNRDLSALLSFYADEVDFYSAGIVNKDFIKNEKISYFKRWMITQSSIIGDPQVDLQENGIISASFRTAWMAQNNEKKLHGTADNIWRFKRANDGLKIIYEKQQVTSRYR